MKALRAMVAKPRFSYFSCFFVAKSFWRWNHQRCHGNKRLSRIVVPPRPILSVGSGRSCGPPWFPGRL